MDSSALAGPACQCAFCRKSVGHIFSMHYDVLIIGAGLRGMVGGNPARDQAETILDQTVTALSGSCSDVDPLMPPCDAAFTRSIVKGLCTVAVSSGPLHIH